MYNTTRVNRPDHLLGKSKDSSVVDFFDENPLLVLESPEVVLEKINKVAYDCRDDYKLNDVKLYIELMWLDGFSLEKTEMIDSYVSFLKKDPSFVHLKRKELSKKMGCQVHRCLIVTAKVIILKDQKPSESNAGVKENNVIELQPKVIAESAIKPQYKRKKAMSKQSFTATFLTENPSFMDKKHHEVADEMNRISYKGIDRYTASDVCHAKLYEMGIRDRPTKPNSKQYFCYEFLDNNPDLCSLNTQDIASILNTLNYKGRSDYSTYDVNKGKVFLGKKQTA